MDANAAVCVLLKAVTMVTSKTTVCVVYTLLHVGG